MSIMNFGGYTGLEMELLWENASPASSFAAQTVQVSLSGYDFAFVYVADAGKVDNANGLVGFIIPVGKSGTVTAINYQINYRKVTVSTNGVTFSDSLQISQLNWDGEAVNDRCIPQYIYGIKEIGRAHV